MKIKEMLKNKKSHLRGDSINEESSGYGSSEGGSATEGGGVRPLGGRGEWAPQHVQAEDDNGLISRWANLPPICPLQCIGRPKIEVSRERSG